VSDSSTGRFISAESSPISIEKDGRCAPRPCAGLKKREIFCVFMNSKFGYSS